MGLKMGRIDVGLQLVARHIHILHSGVDSRCIQHRHKLRREMSIQSTTMFQIHFTVKSKEIL